MTVNAADPAEIKKRERESKVHKTKDQNALLKILQDDLAIEWLAHLLEEHGLHTLTPVSSEASLMAYHTARRNTAVSIFNEILALDNPAMTARIEHVMLERREQKTRPNPDPKKEETDDG